MSPHRNSLPPSLRLFLALSLLLPQTHSLQPSKRGIAYLGDTHTADNNLLLSEKSPLSWYYNWAPSPATNAIPADALEFVPLIHGLDTIEDKNTIGMLSNLPQSSTHLLSFNEPDGDKGSGGSDIEPKDAAKAYVESIVPYREGKHSNRKWNISHPSVTGSPRGLEWLRQFNESCWDIDSENGCPADFIAAHWYGDFAGLATWLDTLDSFYNGVNKSRTQGDKNLTVWITEVALPQKSADDTVEMMNQTLPYLDDLEYVEKYSWFGAFRKNDANEWTGNGVALFANDGGLTDLGALYLGGEENGFKKGSGGGSAAVGVRASTVAVMAVFVGTVFALGGW
ncbi:glycosyl hydrolase catalytic core-domain-containing protein [Clohesyomyces aquaticus]|uniref:Glycosyl hydrolase catalytic core-domain-containing protein n=1 Tax=Clohesyomyces aquaticus TaxID=1231657 RepID=A0A1Y1ZUD9_9PLEO|nr:glycosyl hydrolase catalytic core-domain-containing protein [Clohesyomyces aquaticus]